MHLRKESPFLYVCVSLIVLEPLGYFMKYFLHLGLEGVNTEGRVGIVDE